MSRDLFGFDADRDASPRGETVEVALVLHRTGASAWLVGETIDARAAKWLPFSQASRGSGRDENIWTMPAWLARDRGWI